MVADALSACLASRPGHQWYWYRPYMTILSPFVVKKDFLLYLNFDTGYIEMFLIFLKRIQREKARLTLK